MKLSRSPGSDYEARDIEHHRYHKHQLVLTATGEVPVSRYRRRKSHDGDADQDFADAIHLGVYHIAERLQSAARDLGLQTPPDSVASPLHCVVLPCLTYGPAYRSNSRSSMRYA